MASAVCFYEISIPAHTIPEGYKPVAYRCARKSLYLHQGQVVRGTTSLPVLVLEKVPVATSTKK